MHGPLVPTTFLVKARYPGMQARLRILLLGLLLGATSAMFGPLFAPALADARDKDRTPAPSREVLGATQRAEQNLLLLKLRALQKQRQIRPVQPPRRPPMNRR